MVILSAWVLETWKLCLSQHFCNEGSGTMGCCCYVPSALYRGASFCNNSTIFSLDSSRPVLWFPFCCWFIDSWRVPRLVTSQTNKQINNHSDKSTPKRDSHPCSLKTAVNSGADPDLQHAQVQSVKLLGWKSASQTVMPQCFARKQRIVHCTWGESSSVFGFCPWQRQDVWNCVFSDVDSWYSQS